MVDYNSKDFKLPVGPISVEDIQTSIDIIEKSRHTHVEWIDFLSTGGEEGSEYAGDLAHHRDAVGAYDQVLAVLRAIYGSVKAPGYKPTETSRA